MEWIIAGLLIVVVALLVAIWWTLGSMNEHLEALHGYAVWDKGRRS